MGHRPHVLGSAGIAFWAAAMGSLGLFLLLPHSLFWLLLALPLWSVALIHAGLGRAPGRVALALAFGLAATLWAVPLTCHEIAVREVVMVRGQIGGFTRTLAGLPWAGVRGYVGGMGSDRIAWNEGTVALLTNWVLWSLLALPFCRRPSPRAAVWAALLALSGVLFGGWTLVRMFD